MKGFQVFLMMVFLNICLAQDITLKKLYDGIEDMKLEVNTLLPSRGEGNTRFASETKMLNKLIGEKTNFYCNGSIEMLKDPESNYLYVDKLIRGSFTKSNSKQELGSVLSLTDSHFGFQRGVIHIHKPTNSQLMPIPTLTERQGFTHQIRAALTQRVVQPFHMRCLTRLLSHRMMPFTWEYNPVSLPEIRVTHRSLSVIGG
jgi:hypothetical protein